MVLNLKMEERIMQTGRNDNTLGREECRGRLLAIQLAFPGIGTDREIIDFPEMESPEAIPAPNPNLQTKISGSIEKEK